jgi:hypothetical protein
MMEKRIQGAKSNDQRAIVFVRRYWRPFTTFQNEPDSIDVVRRKLVYKADIQYCSIIVGFRGATVCTIKPDRGDHSFKRFRVSIPSKAVVKTLPVWCAAGDVNTMSQGTFVRFGVENPIVTAWLRPRRQSFDLIDVAVYCLATWGTNVSVCLLEAFAIARRCVENSWS